MCILLQKPTINSAAVKRQRYLLTLKVKIPPTLLHLTPPVVPTFTLEAFSQSRGGFPACLPLAEAAHRGCGTAVCCVHYLAAFQLAFLSLQSRFFNRGPIKDPEDPSASQPL